MSNLSSTAKEAIALHYVKLNSKAGDSVESLRSLYIQALEALTNIESQEASASLSDPSWSL